ncbi:unnamed protein product [Caenorhabditis brenneri]
MNHKEENPDFCLPRAVQKGFQKFVLQYNREFDLAAPFLIGLVCLSIRPQSIVLLAFYRVISTAYFTIFLLRVFYILFC